MSEYPEHERLALVRDRSQIIGEFLEWLPLQGYHLAEYAYGDDRLWTVHKSITQILGEYFGIDPRKIEAEKRAMLSEVQRMNEERYI